jgi:hypothetical protein
MHWSTSPLQKLDIYVRKTNKAHAGHESVMAILACRCEEAMGSLIYWSVASELSLHGQGWLNGVSGLCLLHLLIPSGPRNISLDIPTCSKRAHSFITS